MTKYHTNNPLGSTDPRDLYDNAQNLDVAVNDTENDTWKDRFGRDRKTLKGYDSAFQQFLINSGYQNIGDYGPGLEITARNQIFWRDGELYRAGAVLELPYTTTGDWGAEEGLFVAVGDQALRQELANSTEPASGAGMVGRSVVTIYSVDEMRNTTGAEDKTYNLVSYYHGGSFGGGLFRFEETGIPEDDGGLNIAGLNGKFIRIDQRRKLTYFGADPHSVVDATDALEAAIASIPDVQQLLPEKRIYVDGVFRLNRGIVLSEFARPWAISFIGDAPVLSRFDYYGEEDTILDVPSSEIRFHNIGVRGMVGDKQATFLHSRLQDGRADIDVTFDGCYFYNLDVVHHCYGRGTRDIDCIIGSCNTFHSVYSPDPFTPGPFPGNQSFTTAMRRYVSQNLMVDTLGSVFWFQGGGPTGNWINELTIEGVNGNGLGALVSGSGGIQSASIKTGSLVNSFGNAYAITCGFIYRASIDITARGAYRGDITNSTGIDGIIDSTSETVGLGVESVSIRCNITGLRDALIRSAQPLGNITIDAVLPALYEVWTGSSGIAFLNAPEIFFNKRVHISLYAANTDYQYDTFYWILDQASRERLDFGSVYVQGFQVPRPRNKGNATIASGTNNVTVTHQLGRAPATKEFQLTAVTNPTSLGAYWVSTITDTTFLIRSNNTATQDVHFAWSVG